MNFFDLPVDVCEIICNYLDVRTKINLYNICVSENLAPGLCHLRNVDLSRSTLATVKTLDEKMFRNLGEYIINLNLSGVQDLTVENLKPHINRFVNLKSLDITFTNIYMSDIADVCPQKVKNIGINFFKFPMGFKNLSAADKCRDTFKDKQFQSVHIVVLDYLFASSALIFLKGVPSIDILKITVIDNFILFENTPRVRNTDEGNIEVNFNKITYLFRDFDTDCLMMSAQLSYISLLNFQNLEYILLMIYKTKGIVIYITPIFSTIFTEKSKILKVKVISAFPSNLVLDGNLIFKAWNKATTCFDDQFFSTVLLELKDYFPTYICMHSKTKNMITDSPSSWYCIDSCDSFETIPDIPEKVTLTNFCRFNSKFYSLELPINSPKDCKVLQHLTFLRLCNILIKEDFFSIIFNGCPKLVTLDIHTEKPGNTKNSGYNQSLSKSIHLAKLKNLRLTTADIEYDIIFGILCNCVSLENVHICGYNRERSFGNYQVDAKNILLFVEKCVNLYSLFIESDLIGYYLMGFIDPLVRETARLLERKHLCIKVCETKSGLNPFVDVFNPSPLHIH